MTASWLEPSAKAIVYTGVLAAIGACAIRWRQLPRAERGITVPVYRESQRWLATALAGSSSVVLFALALRVWAHTIDAFGFPDAWTWESMRIIGFESRWGGGWRAQAAAAVVLLVLALWIRRHPRSGWVLAIPAALVLVVSLPLTGHAAGQPFRIALHAIHIAAAGLWAGSLALVIANRSSAMRSARDPLLRAFAPVAMTSVALLAISGGIAAWMYLREPSDLWRTSYGRWLTIKVLLVTTAVFLGALNWRRVHRTDIGEAEDRHVLLEVGILIAVVVVTAWLTETAHPS